MSEPTPIGRAKAIIRANPREYAAYRLGRERGFVDGYAQGWQDSPEGDPEAYDDSADKAAAYLLLAESALDDATLLARAQALGSLAATVATCDRELRAESSLHVRADIEAQREAAMVALRRLWGERC